MSYEELVDAIINAQNSVSSEASDVLQYVLDRWDEGDDDISECDVYDAVMEECDSYFIYYSDAWDYLRDNNITDFFDAVNNGCDNICSIAYWYLQQEINENLCLQEG